MAQSLDKGFMMDFPRAASFIEKPQRQPGERPIFANVSGGHWNSVFIEVSQETYLTEKFSLWLRDQVFGRLRPGGDVRIAITQDAPPVDN